MHLDLKYLDYVGGSANTEQREISMENLDHAGKCLLNRAISVYTGKGINWWEVVNGLVRGYTGTLCVSLTQIATPSHLQTELPWDSTCRAHRQLKQKKSDLLTKDSFHFFLLLCFCCHKAIPCHLFLLSSWHSVFLPLVLKPSSVFHYLLCWVFSHSSAYKKHSCQNNRVSYYGMPASILKLYFLALFPAKSGSTITVLTQKISQRCCCWSVPCHWVQTREEGVGAAMSHVPCQVAGALYLLAQAFLCLMTELSNKSVF